MEFVSDRRALILESGPTHEHQEIPHEIIETIWKIKAAAPIWLLTG